MGGSKWIDLSRHCYKLGQLCLELCGHPVEHNTNSVQESKFFEDPDRLDEVGCRMARSCLPQVGNWLRTAAGIKKVDFEDYRLDDCYGWNSEADALALGEAKHRSRYLTELFRFTSIWSGMEVLVDLALVDPPKRQDRGKFYAASCYIDALGCLPSGFAACFERYCVMVWGDKGKYTFHNKHYLGIAGRALTLVYEMRNKFAHGSYLIPRRYSVKAFKKEVSRIILASRLALLIIQLLLVGYISGETLMIYDPDGLPAGMGLPDPGEEVAVPYRDFLLHLHLECPPWEET